MKKVKIFLMMLLLITCSSVLFACSTTTSDTNIYSKRIALYHNNTEVENETINGVNTYEVSLLSGGSTYVITYFISPSNLTLPGVSVLGGDSKVASIEVDNLNKLIYVTPAESFTEGYTSTTFSINANDEGASINLKVNLTNSAQVNTLPTPELKLENVDGEYYLTWNDDAKKESHFYCYSVTIATTSGDSSSSYSRSTLNNRYKLEATNGKITASVKAISTIYDDSKDSADSNTLEFTLYSAPQKLTYDNDKKEISWEKVANSLNYTLTITSDNYYESAIIENDTKYAFSPSISETYTITLKVQENTNNNVYAQTAKTEVSFLSVLNAQIKDGFITWENDGAASSYNIYCEIINSDNELVTTIKKDKVVSPFSINNVSSEYETNKTYVYYVEAVGSQEGANKTYNSPKIKAGSLVKLAAPTSLAVEESDGKTFIKWSAVDNVSTYEVKIGTNKFSQIEGTSYECTFGNSATEVVVKAMGNTVSNATTIGYISSDEIKITVQKLNSPTLSVEGQNAIWNNVIPGGDVLNYNVILNSEPQNSFGKNGDNFKFEIKNSSLNAGANELKVQAKGFKKSDSEYYVSSGFSSVSLIKLESVNFGIDEKGVLYWTKVQNALNYQLKILDSAGKEETITQVSNETSLSDFASGEIKITLTAKAKTSSSGGVYYFDSAPIETTVYKLHNNPTIKMETGSLKFDAHIEGVTLKTEGTGEEAVTKAVIDATDTEVVYTYTLTREDELEGTSTLIGIFENLSDLEERLNDCGDYCGENYKYIIGVTCSGKGAITSDYNETVFEFYKLSNAFNVSFENEDDIAYLQYNAISNASDYKVIAIKNGETFDIYSQGETKIDLSLKLPAEGSYTFTLQAIGNTTTTGQNSYMTSNIYNVVDENGLPKTIIVLGQTDVQVTTYERFIDSTFDFNNPGASSGNIIWPVVESASGYEIYFEKENGDVTIIKSSSNKNYLTREEIELTHLSAGAYNVSIRAIGNGSNIISRRVKNEGMVNPEYITSTPKQITKLENIENLYTLNSDVKFVYKTGANYNNVSSELDFLNSSNIYVEYVVGIRIAGSNNAFTYYTTFDFNKIKDLLDEGKTSEIIELISPNTTKFSQLNALAEADYELVVYTMPYNAKVALNASLQPELSASTSLYITSSPSSTYTIRKTSKINSLKVENGFIKFNNNDTLTETLTKNYTLTFNANKLMLASLNGENYTYLTKTDENSENEGIQYTFNKGVSRYFYRVDITDANGSTTAVLVPSIANSSTETGNALYNLKVKDILGTDVTGKYTIKIQTLVIGSSLDYETTDGSNYKRLYSDYTQGVDTTILSTKDSMGNLILKTNEGVIEWSEVQGALKYEIVITDSSKEKHTYYISDIIEKEDSSSPTVYVGKSEGFFRMQINEFVAGNYTLTIKVIGDESEFITSEVSEEFAITKLPAINNVSVVNGWIRFELPYVNSKYYDFNDGVLAYVLSYYNTETLELKHAAFMKRSDNSFKFIEKDGKEYYELLFPIDAPQGNYVISLQTIGNNSGLVSGNPIINDLTVGDTLCQKFTITKLGNIESIAVNNNGQVSWGEVDGAAAYSVTLNNSGSINVSNTYVTNSDFEDNNVTFNSGNATMKVYAKGVTYNDLINRNTKETPTVYIDGYYGDENLQSIDIIKLRSLNEFGVKYEDGKIVWSTTASLDNALLNIPIALQVTIEIGGSTHQFNLTYENVDFASIDKVVFDINNYLDASTNFDIPHQDYTISFTNLGGVLNGVNYTNSETSTKITAQKLKNVSNTANEIAAISVECQKTESGYILDRIYFEVFDEKASYYTLSFVNDSGVVKQSYICKTNPSGNELRIVTGQEGAYSNYVVYENTSIEEGTYTIVMQAIGAEKDGVNYLNSSPIESTAFIVPNPPTIYVENEDETLTSHNKSDASDTYEGNVSGTGRIAWEFNPANYKGKTIEYILTSQYLTTDAFSNNKTFDKVTSETSTIKIEVDENGDIKTIDNESASYELSTIDDSETYCLFYSFLNAGYYLVSAVCYVDGLPSKDSNSVIVNYNFFNAGNGTEESPYEIVNLTQLNAIRYRPSAHYVITNNIDINTTHNLSGIDFNGVLSGEVVTIDKDTLEEVTTIKTITIIDGSNASLFNSITESGTIKDLNIVINTNFSGKENVYLIANTNNGTIQGVNVTLNVALTLNYFAGAVNVNNGTIENFNLIQGEDCTGVVIKNAGASAAITNNGTIKNSSNGVEIKSQTNTIGVSVGGIVVTNNGTIKECKNTGALYGLIAGGISAENKGVIDTCVNTSEIQGYDIATDNGQHISYIGGIVGIQEEDGGAGTDYITKCYNTGAITGTATYKMYVGGIVGYFISYVSGTNTTTITYCYNTGNIELITDLSSQTEGSDCKVAVGGIVGYLQDYYISSSSNAIIEYCYASDAVSIKTTEGETSNSIFGAGIAGYLLGIMNNCYTTHTGLYAITTTTSYEKIIDCESETSKTIGDFATEVNDASGSDVFTTDGKLYWE